MQIALTSSKPLRRRLGTLFAKCQAQLGLIFNPYRPELHYMRGPGPKWLERHGAAAFAVTRRTR
jgi:hypothetical protein